MKPLIFGLVRYFKRTKEKEYLQNVEHVFIINVLDLSLKRHSKLMFQELEENIEALLLWLLCITKIPRRLLLEELERIYKLIIQRQIWKKRFDNPCPDNIGILYQLPLNCLMQIKTMI